MILATLLQLPNDPGSGFSIQSLVFISVIFAFLVVVAAFGGAVLGSRIGYKGLRDEIALLRAWVDKANQRFNCHDQAIERLGRENMDLSNAMGRR